ncbi:MAG: hypothetical protein ACI4CS_09820 [Candidatus Weimeria sp.]
MSEFYHAILSERPEDQKKAVEWAKEEQARIKHDKGEEIADRIMAKLTPQILKQNTGK